MTALAQTVSTGLADLLHTVSDIASALPRALAATNDYKRMADLTDAQLAERGLDRADLPKTVYNKHFH